MLNTCTTRIWFVVELCEAIQAKKVELANFELFSSSPREFSVSVSDRVQGREWRPVGLFAASEERAVQSFALSPQLFGRYVKVEVASHHGAEHFCPLSLFRVYGTSEFEVLEKVDQASADEDGAAAGSGRGALGDDDDDEDDDDDDAESSGAAADEDAPPRAGDPAPRNLFESYKNAVFSIVKQAAQALTKSGDGSNETSVEAQGEAGTGNASAPAATSPSVAPPAPTPHAGPSSLCKSPRHLVVCDNCSDSLYSDVFALLSCRERDLEALMASAFVADSLRESGVCARYGLAFVRRRPGAPFPLPAAAAVARADPADYFAALFPPEYVAALCNLLAVADRRVALNVSDAPNATAAVRGGVPASLPAHSPPTTPLEEALESALPAVTCTAGAGGSATQPSQPCPGAEPPTPRTDLASQINPTKTLTKEESGEDTAAPAAPALQGSEAPAVLATAAAGTDHEETAATARAATAPALPVATATANVTATPTAAAPPIALPAPVPAAASASAAEAPAAAAAIPPSDPEPSDPEAPDGEAASAEETPQENLESLLRDLKDLEQSGETGTTSGPPSATPPIVASSAAPSVAPSVAPTVTPSVTPSAAPSPAASAAPSAAPAASPAKAQPQQSVQKESVFVRLANRIKALERNMSLSGQYLEELSRRYKKQVEEMQKAFNRTLQAVHEAGRVGEERETKRQEEMQLLQQQLLQLAGMVEHLVGERDSWFSRFSVLAQHVVLICVEVLIFIFLMYFCRRLPSTNEAPSQEVARKVSTGAKSRKGSRMVVKRRKSVEGVSGHESPRTKNRRPSEEALRISGSYQDLLISEPRVSEIDGRSSHGLEFGFPASKIDSRRRRRKKKDALLRSASIRLPVRSCEPLVNVIEEQANSPGRRASSLELGVWWSSSNGVNEGNGSGEARQNTCDNTQQSVSLPKCSAANCPPSTIECISPHYSPMLGSSTHVGSVQKQESASYCATRESKVRSMSDTVSPLSQNNGLVRSSLNKIPRQLSSPIFMRTATSVRSSRLGSVEPSPPAKLKSDNWEWYSTHHGLDKSSQSNKVKCSVSCPSSAPGASDQRQNGHTESEEVRRNSNASSSASSASNISEGAIRKDTTKKGPSSLKKMVRKFF